MNYLEFVSLTKGQKIEQILVANLYPNGDSCESEILIEEILLGNGVRILFDGSPRAEIKKERLEKEPSLGRRAGEGEKPTTERPTPKPRPRKY